MLEEKIEYKPAETMRICRTFNCGTILDGRNKLYCSQCLKARGRKTAKEKLAKEKRGKPTWTCPNGCIVKLTFCPTKNSNTRIRFKNFIESHVCQTE